MDAAFIKTALSCRCPSCKRENIYKSGLTLEVREKCPACDLKLSEHDCGDGPAVFLIFILGFLLVPLALLLEFTLAPPLWFHAVFWGVVALGMTLGLLRPLKAFVIALQFKHRPEGLVVDETKDD